MPNFPSVEMSLLSALIANELDEQEVIAKAREYYQGKQTVHLTARAEEYLQLHADQKIKLRLNVVKVIVSAVLELLILQGMSTDESGENKPVAAWLSDVFRENQLVNLADDLHEAVLRDREAFLIVDWDDEKGIPRYTLHERFIDLAAAGGTGTGCWMLYENDDLYQPPILAVQQWSETVMRGERRTTRNRRTVYYPNRYERYYSNGADWVPFEGDELPDNDAGEGERDSYVVPWTTDGTLTGDPLGIPVIHFRNKGFSPEAFEALPIQDGINKLFVDVLGAGDLAGFPLLVALGFYPTTDGKEPKTDGSNLIKIAPRSWIGTTKSKTDAEVKQIEAGDLTKLMDTLLTTITLAAQITDTPVSRFVMTKQIAGAETLKEQDGPLMSKVDKRSSLLGTAWVQAAEMGLRLHNVKSANNKLNEKVQISAVWRKKADIDELIKKRNGLKIPLEQLWKEWGYTEKQIEFMKNTDEYKLTMRALGADELGG